MHNFPFSVMQTPTRNADCENQKLNKDIICNIFVPQPTNLLWIAYCKTLKVFSWLLISVWIAEIIRCKFFSWFHPHIFLSRYNLNRPFFRDFVYLRIYNCRISYGDFTYRLRFCVSKNIELFRLLLCSVNNKINT